MPNFFLLSFFFYCYGDHRDLHSFPTRRSSDLRQPSDSRDRAKTARCPEKLSSRVATSFGSGGRCGSRDRKSTRLNSSHSQISYAVFCLKKKKIFQHGRCEGQLCFIQRLLLFVL